MRNMYKIETLQDLTNGAFLQRYAKNFSASGSTLALPAELWAGLEGH